MNLFKRKHLVIFAKYDRKIREFFFGPTNIRIEQLYLFLEKRGQKKIHKIKIYAIFFFFSFLFFCVLLYFVFLYKEQKNLSYSLEKFQQVQSIQKERFYVDEKIKEWSRRIEKSTEQESLDKIRGILQDYGVVFTLDSNWKSEDFSQKDPLMKGIEKFKVNATLENVSLKKILDILVELQNEKNKYMVSQFDMEDIDNTKLYFKVRMTISGFVMDNLVS